MIYFKYALKNIKRGKVISLIAIVQTAIALIVINMTVSEVMRIFDMALFARGFNDPNLYCAAPNYVTLQNSSVELNAEESWDYGYRIESGYREEMGFPPPENERDIQYFMETYDCNERWFTQHQAEIENEELIGKQKRDIDSVIGKFDIVEDIYTTGGVTIVPLLKNREIPPNEAAFIGFGTMDESEDKMLARDINIIDDKLAEKLNMNIVRGKNLAETHNTADTIEAVICARKDVLDEIKIGDTYQISLYNFAANEYEVKTLKIAGILNSPFYSLGGMTTYGSEENVALRNLIHREAINPEFGWIEIFTKPLYGDRENYNYGYNENMYIKTKENASAEEINVMKEYLLEKGYTIAPVKTAYDNTIKESTETVMSNIIIIIISVITALITSFGTTILMIYKNINSHIVYSMCGASRYDNIVINEIYTAIIMLISSLICYGYLRYSNYVTVSKLHDLFGLIYDKNNVFISLILIIAVLLINVIVLLCFFGAKDRKELWRKV